MIKSNYVLLGYWEADNSTPGRRRWTMNVVDVDGRSRRG